MRIVSGHEARRVPWKNGRGTTLELVTDAVTPEGPWTYRLAIADVPEAGPFSSYPGIDRALVLLAGRGLDLDVEGSRIAVPRAGRGVAFPGEAKVSGVPHGEAVRDANLMVDRATWTGTLEVLVADDGCRSADVVLVHAFDGAVAVEGAAGEKTALSEGATLVAEGEARLLVHGRAVIAELRRR